MQPVVAQVPLARKPHPRRGVGAEKDEPTKCCTGDQRKVVLPSQTTFQAPKGIGHDSARHLDQHDFRTKGPAFVNDLGEIAAAPLFAVVAEIVMAPELHDHRLGMQLPDRRKPFQRVGRADAVTAHIDHRHRQMSGQFVRIAVGRQAVAQAHDGAMGIQNRPTGCSHCRPGIDRGDQPGKPQEGQGCSVNRSRQTPPLTPVGQSQPGGDPECDEQQQDSREPDRAFDQKDRQARQQRHPAGFAPPDH